MWFIVVRTRKPNYTTYVNTEKPEIEDVSKMNLLILSSLGFLSYLEHWNLRYSRSQWSWFEVCLDFWFSMDQVREFVALVYLWSSHYFVMAPVKQCIRATALQLFFECNSSLGRVTRWVKWSFTCCRLLLSLFHWGNEPSHHCSLPSAQGRGTLPCKILRGGILFLMKSRYILH